jgi:hypothetical protein
LKLGILIIKFRGFKKMAKIIKLLAIGTIGFAIAKRFGIGGGGIGASSTNGKGNGGPTAVRDAGPANMQDQSAANWSKVDEASDQSFPASDPPATY